MEIQVGGRVRHFTGWTGVAEEISGELMGNRLITVRKDEDGNVAQWLECVLDGAEA